MEASISNELNRHKDSEYQVFRDSEEILNNTNYDIENPLKDSQKILCAKYRKKHFEGVLDVMNRLLKVILPKFVFMGEKDFQQLFLVKKALENKFNTKIISCKTIRNNNKLALSTRNFLLQKSAAT